MISNENSTVQYVIQIKKWNNKTFQCECKNYGTYTKDCSCENGKYLSIDDTSVVVYDKK